MDREMQRTTIQQRKRRRLDSAAAVDRCIAIMEKKVKDITFTKIYTRCDEQGTQVLTELRCQFPLLFYVTVAFVVSSRAGDAIGRTASAAR